MSLDLSLLLRRCHDRMHGLGAGGAEADLSMDMVRLLVSKVHAEQVGEPFDGPLAIRASFAQVRAAHPDIFGAAEGITGSAPTPAPSTPPTPGTRSRPAVARSTPLV